MQTELLNANLLENDYYSGADGDKGMSAETTAMLATTAATLIGGAIKNSKTPEKIDAKSACGRKPLFGRAKKEAYQSCISKHNSSKQSPAPSYQPPVNTRSMDDSNNSKSNVGKYIAFGVLGLAAIVGGIILIKKMGNRTVAAPLPVA